MREINEQQALVEQYGMTDERYNNSFNELTSTLCLRLYKNSMPMVMEVLQKMSKDHYFEGKMCLSNGSLVPADTGPTDLFKILSGGVFTDIYKECPCVEVANALLGLIFK